MANFSINLLTPYINSSDNVSYYRDCLTQFKTGECLFDYTYDEQLSINQNAQEQLTFKMLQNIWENDMLIPNPYFSYLKNGTLIEVVDKYNIKHWFQINNIQYAIKKQNVEISYTAKDFFSTTLSKRENAYEIINDPGSDSFIGAKTLEFWVNKICLECKISFQYVPIAYDIYITKMGTYIAKFNSNYYNLNNLQTPLENFDPSILIQKVRKNLSDIDRSITYALSGSSAANALIDLGTQYGLIIDVDYSSQTFWYKELKNSTFTGLQFSPNTDLQSLSVSQKADNLATIFTITGPTIADEQISLLSNPTPLFMQWFLGTDWENTVYFPGMYSKYLENREDVTAEDIAFAAQADRVPLLENKIFKNKYIQTVYKTYLYNKIENTLFNELRINNGKLLAYRQSYYSALKNKTSLNSSTKVLIDDNGALMLEATINNPDGDTSSTLSNFYDSCKSTTAAAKYVEKYFISPNLVFVLDKNKTITYYGNLYRSALQRYCKNLYNFRKYYNDISDKTNLSTEQIYQLSIYWENAYNAGLYCDGAIPKDWQRTDCWRVITSEHEINNNIVPQVTLTAKQIYKQYTYTGQTSSQEAENWMITFCSTEGYDYNCWEVTEIDGQYEDIYHITTGTVTWSNLTSLCCNLLNDEIYLQQGWYQNFIQAYLLSINSNNNDILNGWDETIEGEVVHHNGYYDLMENNKQIWTNLFQNYSMLLLEAHFSSETATSSEELYKEAMTYYAEYEKPEKTYNLTVTDLYATEGYNPYLITIGEQIALDYSDFYQYEDDLKDLLQEHLFITSISYKLRKDADIQYNVVTTSFNDKLLSKLAHLIK